MVDISGAIWEADNQTSRFVEDTYGDGTLLLAISPDHSRLLGTSTEILGDTSTEKLTWWTYAGDATLVEDAAGNPIEGRFTGGTNADVGYLVGQAGEPSSGDLLHIESTNQTLRIVDWFKSLSGLDVPAETSVWGPEVTFDYGSGQVAIISGGYLFTAKIRDANHPPVAQGDSYATPVDVALIVALQGCWEMTPTTRAARCMQCSSPGLRMAAWNSTTTAASLTLLNRDSIARMRSHIRRTMGTTTATW